MAQTVKNLPAMQETPVGSLPGSSLSRVQGHPQDGRRWRMNEWMTRGDQASVSEARHFIFREGFYTLSCTLSKVKNAESTQHSISINFYRYQVPSCKSYFFVHYLLARRPVDILWPLFYKGWSARTIIFPWSVDSCNIRQEICTEILNLSLSNFWHG